MTYLQYQFLHSRQHYYCNELYQWLFYLLLMGGVIGNGLSEVSRNRVLVIIALAVHNPEVNNIMTSMIDIVFILYLQFFINTRDKLFDRRTSRQATCLCLSDYHHSRYNCPSVPSLLTIQL